MDKKLIRGFIGGFTAQSSIYFVKNNTKQTIHRELGNLIYQQLKVGKVYQVNINPIDEEKRLLKSAILTVITEGGNGSIEYVFKLIEYDANVNEIRWLSFNPLEKSIAYDYFYKISSTHKDFLYRDKEFNIYAVNKNKEKKYLLEIGITPEGNISARKDYL